MPTIKELTDEINSLKKKNAVLLFLSQKREEHAKLLGNEIRGLIPIAEAHGWKSSLHNEGVKIWGEIRNIENFLYENIRECPCVRLLDKPCKPDCTCRGSFSSSGCNICGQYGHGVEPEQQEPYIVPYQVCPTCKGLVGYSCITSGVCPTCNGKLVIPMALILK